MSVHDNELPSQMTTGHTTDTSEDGAVVAAPEFMRHNAPIADPGEALRNPHAAEVNKLNTFLMQKFPREVARTNRQAPESPVDAAIRLLSGMAAGTAYSRCETEYCNLPKNHDGDHGFVNYQPR